MTPELQRILDLLSDAEKYFQNRENPTKFITEQIEPAFVAAGDALKALAETGLKDALRTSGKKFANAKYQFAGRTGESISDGFREYAGGLRELHRAKKLAAKLNNVES